MKRIKLLLAGAISVMAITGALAAPASAGQVNMHLGLSVFAVPVFDCDATATTTGGPAPADISIVASSLVGQSGSANPCSPTDVALLPNSGTVDPAVSFSGSGPWAATIDRLELEESGGCTFPVTNFVLSSTTSRSGPFGGSRVSPGTCPFVPGTVSLSDVTFTQIDMTIRINALGIVALECDATMTIDPGPSMVVSSFTGQAGSANPCDPSVVGVEPNPSTVNPQVSMSGSGPYTGVIDRFEVSDAFSGCSWVATGTSVVSTTSVDGPFAGTDSAPSSNCPWASGTLQLSDMKITS